MMTVKEVSKKSGVTVRALHHYDEMGLLPPVSPMPVIITRPSVDMTKQRICRRLSFSLNNMGQTSVTITGAK